MRVTDITPQKEQSSEPIRLAAYCRVSSSSEDQLHSFATQIRYYRDYEKKHPEYKLVDIYADEGLTGTCMDKRDELNRMLRDCQRGLIDRVITKSVSRLARNTEDILCMVRMLKSIGVSIYFEEQRLDSGTMNLEMFLTLPGMAAQQESVAISQNLRWGVLKRMEAGTYKLSRAPFGYIISSDGLEVYEPEAMIVRRIFDMYLSGIGKCRIAKILNSEKINTRNAKGYWHQSIIEYILTNEHYMGDALLRKNYRTEDVPFQRMKNHGELPQYYVENNNPPIISKATWEAAQALMSRRSSPSTEKSDNNPLIKIIRCSDCGWGFLRRVSNNTAYWINRCSCSTYHQCFRKRIREETVFGAFIKLVLKLKNNPSILESVIKYMEIVQMLNNDNASTVSDIDSEIARLSSQLRVIAQLFNDGVMNQTEYTSKRLSLSNKITDLRSEKRKKITEYDELLDSIIELRNLIKGAEEQWIFDDELFRQIVVEIVVVSNSELRFKLIGGLEFTEYIEERETCRIK